jgi:hypothetical protein
VDPSGHPYQPNPYQPGQPAPVPGPVPGPGSGSGYPPIGGPVPGLPAPRRGRRVGRRRRFTWTRLLLILVIVLLAVYVAPTPWALHICGRFTPLETWQGYGTMQASNGGHYVLYTDMRGGIVGNESSVSCSFRGCDTLFGTAKLCTESGRTYSFTLAGGVHSWLSTDGARTTLDLTGPQLPSGWVVAFHGAWHGPALALSSPDNSFTEVFTRAGAVRTVTSTADAGTATTTVRYGTAGGFAAACQALTTAH